jgi:hypothetical protein
MRWTGHVARFEEMSSAYKIIAKTFEEETLLGKSRRRLEDNVKMVYKIRSQSLDQIYVANDRI